MSIAVICWKKEVPILAIYDTSKNFFLTTHKLKKDFFRETVQFLIAYKHSFTRLYAVFSNGRFSQARQLTLIGNLFALEYKLFIASSTIDENVLKAADLVNHLQVTLPKITWTKIISPAYAHPPHITKKLT